MNNLGGTLVFQSSFLSKSIYFLMVHTQPSLIMARQGLLGYTNALFQGLT